MSSIVHVPVSNLAGYLPETMKLENPQSDKPTIPIFSLGAKTVFQKAHPDSKGFHSMEPLPFCYDIRDIDIRVKGLAKAKENEKLNKVLAVASVAASVVVAAAVIGVTIFACVSLGPFGALGLLFLIPAGGMLLMTALDCRRAFRLIPRLEDELKSVKENNHAKGCVEAHKEYLRKNCHDLQDKLKEGLKHRRSHLESAIQNKMEGSEKELVAEIANFENALAELNYLCEFYEIA